MDSQLCSRKGDLVCGICECDHGFFGETCQCNSTGVNSAGQLLNCPWVNHFILTMTFIIPAESNGLYLVCWYSEMKSDYLTCSHFNTQWPLRWTKVLGIDMYKFSVWYTYFKLFWWWVEYCALQERYSGPGVFGKRHMYLWSMWMSQRTQCKLESTNWKIINNHFLILQGENRFSGKACECDSKNCENNDKVCSGPNQGECTCDGCRCLNEPTSGKPYNGTFCECTPNTQTCRDPVNSTVCVTHYHI